MPILPSPRVILSMALITVPLLAGCAAYRVGAQTLYRPDIQTVYVPIFESESLRRNLGEQLTEAVIKEIEATTPYKVVHTPDADSTLHGRIARETKRISALNQYDDVRSFDTELMVEVRWIDRRGEVLMQQSGIPYPHFNFTVTESATFIPEAGQSLATSHQQTIRRLAQEVVAQMQIWW
jgi:hypothetical protein